MKVPIKKAIRKVYQKLKKNEEKLKNFNSKTKIDKKISKLEKQVKKYENEEKILKTVSPEEIAKLALVLPCTNLKNLLNCEEINLEEKTKLKIVLTDIVQKLVESFHLELPGSEQWIDVTIDLIDIKKIIRSYKNKEMIKKLDTQIKQRRNILKVYKLKNGIKDSENEVRSQNKLEIKKVIKRINLNQNNNEVFIDLNNLISETIENQETEDVKLDDIQDINILDVISAKLKNIDSSEENDSIDVSDNNVNHLLVDKKIIENNLENEELSEVNEESSNETDSESDCGSIDSCKYDNFVNNNLDINLELTENSEEEDIVLENFNEEEDNEEEENSEEENNELKNNNSQNNEKNEDSINDKEKNIKEITEEKYCDIKSEGEKYLENQLVKVFGEKLAKRKPTEDVSSDEEVVDDFFINKTVKKYKPTKADLVRYKELKNKELSHKNKNNDNEENDVLPKNQTDEEKLLKTKNSQKNLFNTQFSNKNQPKKIKKTETNESLHPSWEAKKRMKTNLKIDLNKTSNKKILFD